MLFQSSRYLQTAPYSGAQTNTAQDDRKGVIVPRGLSKLGRSHWVLARPLYRLTVHVLPQVPKGERAKAAILQAKRLAPFHAVGAIAAEPKQSGKAGATDSARVWVATWDSDAVRQMQLAVGAIRDDQSPLAIVPESFLQSALTQGSSALLIQTQVGTEGQVWRDGELSASQAWPALPTTAQWQTFSREHRVADIDASLAQTPPAVRRVPLAASPAKAGWRLTDAAAGAQARAMATGLGKPLLTLVVAGLTLTTLAYAIRLQRAQR
jgi:hypothetical protein